MFRFVIVKKLGHVEKIRFGDIFEPFFLLVITVERVSMFKFVDDFRMLNGLNISDVLRN